MIRKLAYMTAILTAIVTNGLSDEMQLVDFSSTDIGKQINPSYASDCFHRFCKN